MKSIQDNYNNSVDQKSKWDIFVSYASEDQYEVATPLANALTLRGFKVWYDQSEIMVGNSIFEKINEGIQHSRFGVIIFSPSFFLKKWTLDELKAFFALPKQNILPIWYKLDKEAFKGFPLLADIAALKWERGINFVVDEIYRRINFLSENEKFLPNHVQLSVNIRNSLSRSNYDLLLNDIISKNNNQLSYIYNLLISIIFDLDQNIIIRIHALRTLVQHFTLEQEKWDELLQNSVSELLSEIINILLEYPVVLSKDQVHLLLSNKNLPINYSKIGKVIYKIIQRNDSYTSKIFLPASSHPSWEIRRNCITYIIKLSDEDSLYTLAAFAKTTSYHLARSSIIKYIDSRINENNLSENEKVVSNDILNQFINDGKTKLNTASMRQAKETLKLLQSTKT